MIVLNNPPVGLGAYQEYAFLAPRSEPSGEGSVWRGMDWKISPASKFGYLRLDPLPLDPKRAHRQVQWEVQKYLGCNHPRLAQPHPGSVGELPPPPFRFSPEGWEIATQHFNERIRETQAASQRFAGAVQKMLDALAEGKLKSALRPLPGGAIGEDLPDTHWHMERGRQRFLSCCIGEAHRSQ